MVASKQRFFNALSTKPVVAPGKILVDMGGNGDCGFRSLAAAFIDNVLSFPRLHPAAINTLLAAYSDYYPQYNHLIEQPLATPRERMMSLFQKQPLNTFIYTMAYTLRQLAVDKMCAKPELYRGAFVDQHEGTEPMTMRKQGTMIDESSIAAVAEILDMPIQVKVIERGKPLPMHLKYNAEASTASPLTHPIMTIQLEGKHYKPYLTENKRFTLSTVPVTSMPTPITTPQMKDPSLATLLQLIAEKDKQITECFETTRQLLITMVANGELAKEQLLAIYISNMETSDYLQGRIACIGTEYGNEHFLNTILIAQGKALPDTTLEMSADEQLINELVHALARAISIGHMKQEDVFDQIEKTQSISQSKR